MKLTVVCSLLAAWTGFGAIAATNPSTGTADTFFGLTNLYTFHLKIEPDQWAIMEQFVQPKSDFARGPGAGAGPGGMGPGMGPGMGLEFKSGTASLEFEGKLWGNLSVRFKGNSSFRFAQNSLKRSLKLDFNDLEKGRTFFGLNKLNLNNNAMDPSQLREALAYHVFRAGGVPAGRTAFAKVFVTVPGKFERAFAGIYTAVEQVDDHYLTAHCGAKGGLLLKPEHLPGLPYFGDNWSAYTNLIEVKGVAKPSDTRRFIEMVKLVNQSDSARFQAAIGDYMEVDEFLRFLAVEGLLANMDSPLMTGHNYYLHLNPKTRKFSWLPWDLNEAFGGFFPGGNASEQAELSVDHPFTSVNRLAERLLQAPATQARYRQIVRDLLATSFSAEKLFPVIDSMAATVRPAVASDKMLTVAQFEAALSTTNPPATTTDERPRGFGFQPGRPNGPRGTRPAIKAFISQRVASVQLQLQGKSTGYVPREMRPGQNGPRPFGPPMAPPQ